MAYGQATALRSLSCREIAACSYHSALHRHPEPQHTSRSRRQCCSMVGRTCAPLPLLLPPLHASPATSSSTDRILKYSTIIQYYM
jgi:hypothetical protein